MDGLKDYSLNTPEEDENLEIDGMSQAELLALHTKIEAKLEGIDFASVNLVRETMIQFQKAKVLQESAADKRSGVPVNQRAQVQNSIAAILTNLTKMQNALYSSESHKRIQAAVIKIVRTLPKEQQDHFFLLLENELNMAQQETEAVKALAEAEAEDLGV